MPVLNWDVFSGLPGAADSNFEMLCRHLIRRHYARFGHFAALASQPGVEFDLKLEESCSLGKRGDWYGWQCRWYGLPSGKPIGPARRRKIEEALRTTEKHLPSLTDWVLWTHHSLTEGDQKWFYALHSKFRLSLWTAAEVEEHLSGEASILRATYFGELVLTPQILKQLHEISVAPIRLRWQPETHQTVDAERQLRQALAETGSWQHLQEHARELKSTATQIDLDNRDLPEPIAKECKRLVATAFASSALLSDTYTALMRGDLDIVRQVVSRPSLVMDSSLGQLPRKLRGASHAAALQVTNAVADIRQTLALISQVAASLGQRIVSVLAEAGYGKTQLAAQITASEPARPAGILLHGRELSAGQTLDDLARKSVIGATQFPTMEALLEALNAAGERAHRRLPLVIDGLNESEDPRDWQPRLAAFEQVLGSYPYVLAICTIRTGFADEALPLGLGRVQIEGFGADMSSAIRKYFDYYKINPTDAQLPWGMLRQPLTLRIFCEVTNPERKTLVGVEAMPGSLTALFDRYIDRAADRIFFLSSRHQRYYMPEVHDALDNIGMALWEQRDRTLETKAIRDRLGDSGRQWDRSIVRALESEGMLLRYPGDRVGGVYDALSGHLIANALLRNSGSSEFETWLKTLVTSFSGEISDRHPLASDVFAALVGLCPKFFYRQLWTALEEPLRSRALRLAADSEGRYLDADTISELSKLVGLIPGGSLDLLNRLRETRGSVSHPLNAKFLDAALREMRLPDRDLRWTEWVRAHQDDVLADIRRLENRWRKPRTMWPNAEPERLRARWVMWLLTSTVREIRDRATKALCWFGRGDPSGFLHLVIECLGINDPYVPERMLAAAYGSCMALNFRPKRDLFRSKLLPRFARDLYFQMFAPSAPHSTTHALTREYARRILELAQVHSPGLFAAKEEAHIEPPYKGGGIRRWEVMEDPSEGKYRDGNAPLGLDFVNYTIGRLIPERHNYDFDHAEYKRVVGFITWRIYQLGYSLETFGEIDKRIAGGRYMGRSERPPAERYGKKYAWIAYFEQFGLRQDEGLLKGSWRENEERSSDADIDPSFPESPYRIRLIGDILGDRSQDIQSWVNQGPIPEFGNVFIQENIGRAIGPWLMLQGHRYQRDEDAERIGFVSLESFLLLREDRGNCLRLLRNHMSDSNLLPEEHHDHHTFAGEIPWCNTFQDDLLITLDFVVGTRQVEVAPDDPRYNWPKIKAQFGNSETLTFAPPQPPRFEERQILKRIPVYLPFRTTSFESGIERSRAEVPGKIITKFFNLWLDLPHWNFCDRGGRVCSIASEEGESGDSESHLLFRQELVDEFLNSQKLDLFWVVEGHRQHFGEIHLARSDTPSHGYRRFRQVFAYARGRANRVM